ncbi:hypothetical protein [Micromonospora parva]|uniref:hypothetical protein n=1 Tax=Micromonospora parva TaxID=1464048 RepID=UPI0033C97611
MWQLLRGAQRQEKAEQESRRRELRHLEFLRDEIFAKPDIARMYWHTRHPGDLQALTSDAFTDIADQLRPADPGPPCANRALIGLLGNFIGGLTEDDRAHLLRQLGIVFRSFERGDLADQLNAISEEGHEEAEA